MGKKFLNKKKKKSINYPKIAFFLSLFLFLFLIILNIMDFWIGTNFVLTENFASLYDSIKYNSYEPSQTFLTMTLYNKYFLIGSLIGISSLFVVIGIEKEKRAKNINYKEDNLIFVSVIYLFCCFVLSILYSGLIYAINSGLYLLNIKYDNPNIPFETLIVKEVPNEDVIDKDQYNYLINTENSKKINYKDCFYIKLYNIKTEEYDKDRSLNYCPDANIGNTQLINELSNAIQTFSKNNTDVLLN